MYVRVAHRASLLAIGGPSSVCPLLLAAGATIGRAAECELRVVDVRASRRHALVWGIGGATAIEDLGSRNGTWINGRCIRDIVRVRSGDLLMIGSTTWRLLDESELAPCEYHRRV